MSIKQKVVKYYMAQFLLVKDINTLNGIKG